MNDWRLILSPPLDGSSNMAIDGTLFNVGSRPTLRLYSWLKPTLSIGYFQKIDEPLQTRCREGGVEIVRRPTGGRALLHQYEVTYSVFSPFENFPAPPRLKEIYSLLARWQVESLREIGIDASISGRCRGVGSYSKKKACFATSTPYEINVAGKKIAGNAQKMGKKAFLQHGSILLDIDEALSSFILGEEMEKFDGCTTLKRERSLRGREEIIKIMTERFERVVGCRLTEGTLTEEEEEELVRLKNECHYSSTSLAPSP